MKISLSGVWDDAVRMLRANASLFIAVAGAFLFLPPLVGGYVAPPPTGGAASSGQAMYDYIAANWQLLLIVNLIGFIGTLVVLILALDEARPTVGKAIGGALPLLPTYFVTSILSFLMIALGSIALILPGIYLIGRLAPAGAVIVAERRHNPLQAIGRSFAVTKGNGWANAALILIVVLTYLVLNAAATFVFGFIFLLIDRAAGGGGIGRLLLLIVQNAIGAGFNVVLALLFAALYRRLAAAQPSSRGI